jgi:hypothetical protein
MARITHAGRHAEQRPTVPVSAREIMRSKAFQAGVAVIALTTRSPTPMPNGTTSAVAPGLCSPGRGLLSAPSP